MTASRPALAALLQAGLQHQNAGRLGDAEVAYRQVLTLAPREPNALRLLASIERRHGRLAEAAELLRQSLTASPDQPEVWNTLANVLLAAGRIDDALQALDRAIELARDMQPAHFNRARGLLRAGRVDEARDAATLAIGLLKDPSAAASHLLGSVEMAAGRLAEASRHFEAALQQGSPTAALWHDHAVALQRLHRHHDALAAHEQARAMGLDHADAHYNLGNTLQSLGRLDDAAAAYRRALALEPAHPLAMFDLARLRWRQGDPDFDAQLVAAANDGHLGGSVRCVHAGLLLRAGRAAEAEAMYVAALGQAPEDAALHDGLARARLASGDCAGAIAAHQRAITLAPADAPLRNTFAASLLAAGQPAAAALQAEAALALSPTDSYAMALLGQAWRETANVRESWLNDYARFVGVFDLPAPSGFADMASFCTLLAAELAAMHVDRRAPIDQTLRHGTQTMDDIFARGHPTVDALKGVIAGAVQAFVDGLPVDPTHPFLSRRTAHWRFTGSWSSRLGRGGFHSPHVHPQGWVSAVCYVALPPATADPAQRSGWLHLGQPEAGSAAHATPRRWVQPRVGRLVVFPSMFWHGTAPFDDVQPRLTIAFDVVPTVAGDH